MKLKTLSDSEFLTMLETITAKPNPLASYLRSDIWKKISELAPSAQLFIDRTTVGFTVGDREFSCFCDSPSERLAALADCLSEFRKHLKDSDIFNRFNNR